MHKATSHVAGYAERLNLVAGGTAVATAFFLPLSTSLTGILFVLGALWFILAGNWPEKLQFIYQRRALLLLAVLFVWMMIGMAYTSVSFTEALATLSKYDKLLLGIFFVPVFLEEKWRKLALHAFFAAIAVTLAVALLKEVGLFSADKKFGHLLVFKDRIQTSFLMAMAAYFSGVLFFEQTLTKMRWLYAAFFMCCVFFLFSIDGRSGYFIFFPLLAWLLWSRWRWKGALIAMGASIAILTLAYLFSPAFNIRLQESIHDTHVYQRGENNTSLGLRTEFAKHSLELIKKHPLLGTGTGSFTAQYAQLNMPEYLKTRNPHNQYIHILVQWGAVGLALLLGMFCIQWLDSYQLSSCFRQIAQGTLIAIALGSLANSWLLDTTEGHFYVYFMALAFASQLKAKKVF
jgi:O-antigen ligase